jgi:hypothetical protein
METSQPHLIRCGVRRHFSRNIRIS